MWPAHLRTMFQSRKVAPHPAPSAGASTEHLLICTSCSSSKAWALAIPGRSAPTSTASWGKLCLHPVSVSSPAKRGQ